MIDTLFSYDPYAVLAQYVDFATLQAFIHFKQNPNCFDLHADLFLCVCSLRCFPYLDKSIKVFYIPIKWITFCPTRIRTTLIRIV